MASVMEDHRIIDLTIGPMQIGNFCNAILLGVVLLQAGQYYIHFRDPAFVRSVVAFVILLDVLQTAVMMYMTWEYSVTHFGDFAFASKSIWALSSIPFYCVPIAWIVQGFYAWRLWTLTNRRLGPILIIISSAISGLAGIGAGIGSFLVNTTADNVKLEKVAIVWFVFAMLCDVMIMIGMFWTLIGMKTGIRDTDSLITKINRTIIGTGLASTLTVMIDTIFLFRIGGTDMHLIPVMIVGKVYSNSFLYLLNSRIRHRVVHVEAHTVGGMAKSFRDAEFPDSSSGDLESGGGRTGGPGMRKRKVFSEMKFTPFEALSTAPGGASEGASATDRDSVKPIDDEYEMVGRGNIEPTLEKGIPIDDADSAELPPPPERPSSVYQTPQTRVRELGVDSIGQAS